MSPGWGWFDVIGARRASRPFDGGPRRIFWTTSEGAMIRGQQRDSLQADLEGVVDAMP